VCGKTVFGSVICSCQNEVKKDVDNPTTRFGILSPPDEEARVDAVCFKCYVDSRFGLVPPL